MQMKYKKKPGSNKLYIPVDMVDNNGGGGGGGGGVTSWNDLEDKPFGEEIGQVQIFSGMAYDRDVLTDSDGNFVKSKNIIAGDTYIITVDGTEYTGVASSKYDSYFETDVPFIFDDSFSTAPVRIYTYGDAVYSAFEDGGRHDLKIEHVAMVVTPIDERFLPDSVKAEVPTSTVFRFDWDSEGNRVGSCNKTYEECYSDYYNNVFSAFVYDEVMLEQDGYFAVNIYNIEADDTLAYYVSTPTGIMAGPPNYRPSCGWVYYAPDGSISSTIEEFVQP